MGKNQLLTINFFKDKRGKIYICKIKNTEFNIIFTKAGIYRAGDYHSGKQYSLILKGRFKITLRKNNKDITKKYGPNELITIPPNIPHLYKSITDTVMIQWLSGSYKEQYYEPYRKIIQRQLERLKN